MTEPVARAASPRRTVRVAAALVAGQATLCAVVGWVTFGSPRTASPPSAAHQVGPQVVPPIVVPTISLGLPPTAGPVTSSTSARPRSSARPPKPPRPSSTPEPRETADASPPATPASPAPTTTESTSAAPLPGVAATKPPSALPEVQGPVVEGEPCEPAGALGQTAEGVQMRCVRDGDDRPRWQII